MIGILFYCATLRARTEVALLVDGVDERQTVGLCIVVVVARRGGIVERCAEAVQHAAEVVALAIGAQHFGQVARRHEDVLQLVDVTVLTGHVGIDNLVAENVGRAFIVVVGLTGNHLEVAVLATGGDAVAGHLLHGEVHHHRARGVHDHVDALIVELLPIDIVLRQVGSTIEVGDGVNDVGTGGVLHSNTRGNTRCIVRHVRQHFHEDGVVEHRRVEQLFLHGFCQVFILPDAPRVVLVETLECLVVGREYGLRTSLLQRFRVAQIVDEPQIVVESTCQYILVRILQLVINTTSQPTRVITLVVQVVTVLTRKESTTGNCQT